MQHLLERLYAAQKSGVVLGLDRIERCLAALGHPERAFAVRVHIGGTNGKGSTSSFVAAVAQAAGRRTGLFLSPHLSEIRERFVIDGEPAAAEAMNDAAEEVARTGIEGLTFFEHVTAMGLLLFARAGVEVAVLEVGLGGRLDATNAVAAEVAAVTGVAMDHQKFLGDTLAAIAAEKAGIFKPGQRVVIGRAGEPEAVPWLAEAARTRGAASVTVVDAPVPADWPLGLAGAHQRDNAACALAIVSHLNELGHLHADEATSRRGLAAARLAGRLERLQPAASAAVAPGAAPGIIVDGAHNPHAARMLARAMADLPRPLVLVVSISRDKDAAGMIDPLIAGADAVIATQYAQERALPAADLAALVRAARPGLACEPEPAAARAIERGCALAAPAGTVLITGSLFLVGEARQIVQGAAADPLPVRDPVDVPARDGPGRA